MKDNLDTLIWIILFQPWVQAALVGMWIKISVLLQVKMRFARQMNVLTSSLIETDLESSPV